MELGVHPVCEAFGSHLSLLDAPCREVGLSFCRESSQGDWAEQDCWLVASGVAAATCALSWGPDGSFAVKWEITFKYLFPVSRFNQGKSASHQNAII